MVSVHDHVCCELDSHVREAVRSNLVARLVVGKHTQSNQLLIERLLGINKGPVHCHRRGTNVELAVIGQYRCAAVVTDGGRCIASAMYRHHKPRRSGQAYSELLLLVVDEEFENKGIGTALTDFIKEQSAGAGSSQLIVVSSDKTLDYWMQPPRSFAKLADLFAVEGSCKLVKPWSDKVQFLGVKPETAAAASEPCPKRDALESLARRVVEAAATQPKAGKRPLGVATTSAVDASAAAAAAATAATAAASAASAASDTAVATAANPPREAAAGKSKVSGKRRAREADAAAAKADAEAEAEAEGREKVRMATQRVMATAKAARGMAKEAAEEVELIAQTEAAPQRVEAAEEAAEAAEDEEAEDEEAEDEEASGWAEPAEASSLAADEEKEAEKEEEAVEEEHVDDDPPRHSKRARSTRSIASASTSASTSLPAADTPKKSRGRPPKQTPPSQAVQKQRASPNASSTKGSSASQGGSSTQGGGAHDGPSEARSTATRRGKEKAGPSVTERKTERKQPRREEEAQQVQGSSTALVPYIASPASGGSGLSIRQISSTRVKEERCPDNECRMCFGILRLSKKEQADKWITVAPYLGDADNTKWGERAVSRGHQKPLHHAPICPTHARPTRMPGQPTTLISPPAPCALAYLRVCVRCSVQELLLDHSLSKGVLPYLHVLMAAEDRQGGRCSDD